MDTAVKLERVTKVLGGCPVLHGVCLSVNQGEVFGCLGPNGSGKTTTLRIISGLLRPDGGVVTVLGKPVSAWKRKDRVRLSLVQEYPALYQDVSVLENLRYHADLFGVARGEKERRIEEALERVHCQVHAGRLVRTLSKGTQRRVSIARALVHMAELYVLDEPTAGLDPESQQEMQAVIRWLRDTGRTVLLSSHNLHEVQSICDRVGIIRLGQIRRVYPVGELIHEDGQAVLRVTVSASAIMEVSGFLKRSHDVLSINARGQTLHCVVGSRTQGLALASELSRYGKQITDVGLSQGTVEDAYFDTMGEDEGDE